MNANTGANMNNKSLRLLIGLALLATGALCVYYTSVDGAEQHRQSAEAHGAPPRKHLVTGIGWALVGGGAAALLTLAPKRRATSR